MLVYQRVLAIFQQAMFDNGRSLAKTFVGCLDTDWLLGIAPRESKRYDVLKSHCKIAMKYDSFLLGLYIYIYYNIHWPQKLLL